MSRKRAARDQRGKARKRDREEAPAAVEAPDETESAEAEATSEEPEVGSEKAVASSAEAEAGAERIEAGVTGPEPGSDTEDAESVAGETVPLDQFQRLLADFDNYRKRTDRERDQLESWVAGEVLSRLLPILDDFERAEASLAPGQGAFDKEGILIIKERLAEALKREGLREVAASPGDLFDPEIHEAVLTIPSEEISEGHVAEVLQRGYAHGDRLLRPARVAVASGPAKEPGGDGKG